MEHTADKKKRIPLWLWLCYGLLLLLAFTGSSLAGYKTTASGSDSARVAAFRYDAVFTGTNCPTAGSTVTVNVGDGVCFTFSVSNYSGNARAEVALRYSVLLKKAGAAAAWLPDGVTLSRDMLGTYPFTWDSAHQAYRCDYPTVLQPTGNQTDEAAIFIGTENTVSPTLLEGLSLSVLFEQVD